MTANGSNRRAGLLVVSCMTVALVLIDSATVLSSTNSPPAGFCKRNLIVRDFLKPLARLPQSRLVPKSGKLSFGPKGLRLIQPKNGLVVIGIDRFSLYGTVIGEMSRTSLGWSVTSRLLRVGVHARSLSEVKKKRQYIAKASGFNHRDFGFAGRVKPGIYELEIGFKDASGNALGAYRMFFRAVGATSDLKLGISSSVLQAGSYGYLRLENYGTVKTSYSYEYQIWSVKNGDRSQIPLEPPTVSGDLPAAPIGEAGRCFTFLVPDDVGPGAYEVGIRVDNALLGKPELVFAGFNVG